MKRLFGGSCVGLLLVLLVGGATALFAFSIFFNQSQAVTSNATAATAARAKATQQIAPSDTPTPNALPRVVDDVAVQITTDDAPTTQPTPIPNAATTTPKPVMTLFPTATAVPSADSMTETATDVPRHSGTSTYPLTVTAEVMLAQTSVARYQGGVAATRTAIAAESVGVFATLTARAPTAAEVKP